MTKKNKGDGLEGKVFKIPRGLIIKEDYTRYLPWCDYFPHRGIIKSVHVCEERKCKYYKKLYI